MYQKGVANIILVVVLVVIVGGVGGYFVLNRQAPSPESVPTPTPSPTQGPVSIPTLSPTPTPLPTRPVISQLSPSSGPVGTMVIINGNGFTPSGEDKREKRENEVYMEMSKNYTGYLGSFGASSDGKELRFTIPSGAGSCSPGKEICTKEIISISPGDRKIYVKNTRGLSNVVVFTVTTAPMR